LKRWSATCLLALVGFFAIPVGPAAAAESPVRIRRMDASDFPLVSMTVSMTGENVKNEVRLSENNRTVSDFDIQPLSEAGREVHVMLVVDTSGSMKGEPIASAVAAALKFVTSLPDEVKVGIVTFSDNAKLLHAPTLDHPKVLGSLGGLKATGETALYDAVKLAAKQFAGSAQRNVVLLSDGADTSSRATLNEAVGSVQRAGASIFAVGLTSGEFDAGALRELSSKGSGRYSPADTADLSSVYQDLATELSNQYLISYESGHMRGGEVDISVSTSYGRDSALTLTPELKPLPRLEIDPGPPSKPLLRGQAGLLVVLGTCFGTFFVLTAMLLGTAARKRRARELARRTSSAQHPTEVQVDHESRWIPAPLVSAAEAVGEIGGVTGKIERRLERAGAPLRAGEFLLAMVLAAFVGAAFGMLLLHSILFSMLAAVLASTTPLLWLSFAVRRRLSKLHDQLADMLMILASSLRAGHSFFQAVDMVSKEIAEPGASELGRVVAEVRLGRPIQEAMGSLAERIGSEDFKWALLAVSIQREVGGNLAEVLDTVADTIRERDTIRRQIDVLTSEGRLSVAILTALPIGVALWMAWVNPEYIGLLFSTGLGMIMTGVAVCLLGVGVFWMKKVVKIDV
jgi:tight adherence protein B